MPLQQTCSPSHLFALILKPASTFPFILSTEHRLLKEMGKNMPTFFNDFFENVISAVPMSEECLMNKADSFKNLWRY